MDKNRKKSVLATMIELYCRKNHSRNLCRHCQELLDYSYKKIDSCPFLEEVSFCSSCEVHCFSESRRQEIKKVMRFSGPRMIFYHPLLTLKHWIYSSLFD